MLKKKLTSTKLASPVMKCGDCLYYKCGKKPGSPCSCSEQGVKSYAEARVCFFPNVTLISTNIDGFATLATLFSSFSVRQKRVLASLLLNAPKTKKKPFAFGTKVYFSRGTGEYLSHFSSGYVLGYAKDGKVIISGGVDKKTIGRSFIAYLDPKSVIGYMEYAKVRRSLVMKNRIVDPKDRRKVKRIVKADQYEPPVPTIDDMPKEWLNNGSGTKRKMLDSYDKMTTVLEY